MIKLGDQEILFNTIESDSIDAIITDPPYNLTWNHKIETKVDFEKFLDSSYRVLKKNGFLVYFGQEPSISKWNVLAQEKFHYLAEIIWYKRGASNIFQYPLKVHEKIVIFTKGDGKLFKALIDWEQEKEEIVEYVGRETVLRTIQFIKKTFREQESFEKIQEYLKTLNGYEKKKHRKINDMAYKNFDSKVSNDRYLLLRKKLTTLWGCRPHNHQGYNKAEFNVKHPTVKPIQVLERLIEMTTQENQVVLDPFLGSGTTGIACKKQKRDFIGFEIFEEYFDIAQKRIEEAKPDIKEIEFDFS